MKQTIYMGLVGLVSFFMLLLGLAFSQQQKANRALAAQNKQIKEQQAEIKGKNHELSQINEELRQTQEETLLQRDLLEEKNEMLEMYSQKITASIQSAKMIQNAILPSTERFSSIFNDNFILFMPKDVVSGDFYWVHSVADYRFLVVADCTGHGVSGAFMTMIANGLLDRIVRVSQIYEPQEILVSLNEQIRILLQQEQTQNNDGMDIGILRIETTNFVFAGAKRPLYFAQNGQVEKIAGVRKSIGGHQNDNKQFTQIEIKAESPTTFYLTTDGYADQNDPQRTSFSEKRLINMLSIIQEKTLSEQKNFLEKALDQHMAGTEQRDDILVVGVRI